MSNWKEVLANFSPDAEGRMAELRGRLYSQLGGVGPLKIIPFQGYGTPERLFLRGRVIEEMGNLAGEKDDRLWANLARIYTRAQAKRVPHATVAARFQDVEKVLTADENGFFEVNFEPTKPLAQQRTWHPIELQLVSPIPEIQSRYPIKATGQVLIPPTGARYGVISTIDHTLLPSGPTGLTLMARSAFLRTPRARLPFPGESALYQAFYGGLSGTEMNPVFYISSSSGDLHDLLVQQMNLQSMPSGPVLYAHADPGRRIRRMLELYPRLPFVLIGDAEREEAEIYTSLACSYPGRVAAIYLRAARTRPGRAEHLRAQLRPYSGQSAQSGCLLALGENVLALARLATDHGFISPGALAPIAAEMRRDERPLSVLEALIGEAG